MTENQERPLHPLIEKALEMAYEGFEPIKFDDYAVEQLQDMLKEYFGRARASCFRITPLSYCT